MELQSCRSTMTLVRVVIVLLSAGALLLNISTVPHSVGATGSGGEFKPFPAYFIFGDSLVDVGNNNYITTVAKASSLPFGIDFPQGPTGRFSNGKTVTDVLCELVSLPYPPPYLAPTTRGAAILQGVNYASAAAGIVRRTGYNFIGRVDTDTQLIWFANTIKEIKEQLGESGTEDLLKRSLYSITVGANDYVNNYLLKGSPTPEQYTTSQFQELLLTTFSKQLTQLYMLGARNISVSSIGPIGCIPSQLARRSVKGECSDYVNNLALDFNTGLKSVIAQLSSQLPKSNFVYAESFDPVYAYRSNPQQYGFQVGDKACCGGGRFNG
ncbi:hypothetical protein GOP47_0003924 [Adiantum capillus-veneris]|uniref:GDSL esterase/lipase n=1 Tax=Adiantum capillus-veneris TaxID=13818 RepID=A0A9D4ZP90_ADICA|nr:hypothetical protein GOP47_0003924 [Adiantum capillus-veneris]